MRIRGTIREGIVAMYEKSYEKEITVYQYECDVKNRMTAAALLKQVQQISTEHCDIFGLDAAYYQSTNTAFLLSKISLQFHREIMVGEKLKMVTQPSLPVKAIYHRYTSVYDEQEKEVASVDSRWILVDTQTRRILRKVPENFHFPFLTEQVPEHPCKLIKSDRMEPAGKQTAVYSKVDQNGHLNNTEYAAIVCDLIPLSQIIEQPVRSMVLAYHNELRLGETMNILMGPIENGYDVVGEWEGKTCFEANILF